MKAVRFHQHGGPEVLRYEDAPDPEPGPDDVLIHLRAASLNRLDLWVRQGLRARSRTSGGAGGRWSGAGSASVGTCPIVVLLTLPGLGLVLDEATKIPETHRKLLCHPV